MFHEALELKFNEGTELEVTFTDGMVKGYDMSCLYDKYPQLRALEDRKLFTSGYLIGPYVIVWNDDLDIGTDTIYEEGWTVKKLPPFPGRISGHAVMRGRAEREITQKQLAVLTGIDQSDISKIERGIANPTVGTLERIANALGMELKISLVEKEDA
jgi:DNA-binding XRE family transcriptional regulator